MTETQPLDRRQAERPGARERRTARPLRDHLQAIFDTLREELAKDEDHARLVMGLKTWRRAEDLMLDCPPLVPLTMEMAWRRKDEEAFQPLFATIDGPATAKSDVLLRSGASFTQLLLGCLTASARIICTRRENEWLAAERSKGSLFGALARLLGLSGSNARLLKRYSRRGLHDVLKPHLVDAAQFDALTAYAMLPTRTAEFLGLRLRGMTNASAIETFAGLDDKAARFAVALADVYATATAGESPEEGDGLEDVVSAPVADRTTVAGRALTELLAHGTTALKNAMAERRPARDVVMKMAGALGKDVWLVLTHGHIKDIVHCSPPIALGFGAAAAHVDPAVARVLEGINDDKVALNFAKTLVEVSGVKNLAAWMDADAVTVWKSVVMDINSALRRAASDGELSDEEQGKIRALCEGMADRFAPVDMETSGAAMEAIEKKKTLAEMAQDTAQQEQ